MYLFQRIMIILFMIYYFFSVHYYVVVADYRCIEGCALAFASYSLHRGYYDEFVSDVSRRLFPNVSVPEVLSYNPSFVIPLTQAEAEIKTTIKIPFPCDCLNGGYLGHVFPCYLRSGDTYGSVAAEYTDLVTEEWLMMVNSYPSNNIPDNNVTLNVIVNCSCGNKDVSEDYGLFITYPIRQGETLESVALATNTSSELIQMYYPAVNFSAGTGLLYIPGRDKLGNYPPMPTSKGSSGKFIAGMAVASLAGVTLLIGIIYVGIFRKKAQKVVPHISASADQSHPSGQGLLGIAVDKSVEFSYKELAESTNGFSISNKIGEGGFGAIYYAELRDNSHKQMKRQAKTEFLTELQILTRVHHLNLVCLIGYCVEREGHTAMVTRVQIALDSARGLEYIHEHSVPVCIHRDIKSANILISKKFHAKVGDFGLTKLVENGNSTLPTRFMGTFGYMAPEYGRSGIISPKVDVYAFGVVLYELISSKEAVVKEDGVDDARSLVALFEETHNHPNPIESISRLIDPKLGNNYPFDSVHKMAQLAKACTEKDHQMRPTMKSVVVALMAFSSSTED